MKNRTRGLAAAAVLLTHCAGCIEVGKNETTASPTAEHVAICRHWMLLKPDADISPLGYKSIQGWGGSSLYFKFSVKAASLSEVFQDTVALKDFQPEFVIPWSTAASGWWDPETHSLLGGETPLSEDRWLYVGAVDQGDGTFLVYALWWET